MAKDKLFNYEILCERLQSPLLAPLLEKVPSNLELSVNHGDFPVWLQALHALPQWQALSSELVTKVRVGEASQCNDNERAQLQAVLMCLHPWRKGPFELCGLDIDTEWRSDWKWDRLLPHISPLSGRIVLDVGCGNGYHCWRMAGAGASLVIGIDPHLLFNMQYWAVRHFLPAPPVWVLPLALEDMPANMQAFDTVFSLGVFYHRRSPFDHLFSLKQCLRAGGELVLETLVIEGDAGMTLVPEGRYARMNNVWFLPTCNTLLVWLQKAGFTNIRLVDVAVTTLMEQRATQWMTFESLAAALDQTNPLLTVEGHPAPRRAVFIAQKPW